MRSEYFIGAVGCAFLVSWAAPLALRPVLEAAGVMDVPQARSSHEVPVVRGGGIAQVLGLTVGVSIGALGTGRLDQKLLFLILATCVAAAALGLIEDLLGVQATTRASFQFLIGLVATSIASAMTNNPMWWGALGGIALLGLINVVNFMDGLNGISSLHGIVVGSAFVTIGLIHETEWLTVSGAVLASAYAAFLPWNLSGRIFLGDVGSYLLGAAIAILVTIGWMEGLPIIALAAPMALYVADTGVTLVSRVAAGERWHEAHRDHTYQRLHQAGLSHVKVSTIVASLSVVASILGLVASRADGLRQLVYISAIFIVVLLYTAVRYKLGKTDLPATSEENPQ